jgi:hypothetical protein
MGYASSVSVLPEKLVARLSGADAAVVERAVEGMLRAFAEQYQRERRAFDPIEGDNARTFAWDIREHAWARMAENFEDDEDIALVEEGLPQSVHAGGLIIRPYKMGSQAPLDINAVRLDPSSGIKVGLGQRNRQVVENQLAFDLSAPMAGPTAAELEAAYAARELVFGHFGNPVEGQRAIFLGAPRATFEHGSYWEWVEKLRDGDADPAPAQLTNPSPRGPVDTPYSERGEPDLPLMPRRDTRPGDAPL